MEHGTTLLAILHIFIAVVLSVIVLLQDSKNSGVGGTFGGGGSNSVFGATGAEDFLAKTTRVLGFLFAGTCIGLTLILSHRNSHSVVDTLPTQTIPLSAPATAPQGTPMTPNGAVPQAAPPVSK